MKHEVHGLTRRLAALAAAAALACALGPVTAHAEEAASDDLPEEPAIVSQDESMPSQADAPSAPAESGGGQTDSDGATSGSVDAEVVSEGEGNHASESGEQTTVEEAAEVSAEAGQVSSLDEQPEVGQSDTPTEQPTDVMTQPAEQAEAQPQVQDVVSADQSDDSAAVPVEPTASSQLAEQEQHQAQTTTPTPSSQELELGTYDAGKLLVNNKVYALSRKAGSDVVVTNRGGVKLAGAADDLDGYWRVKNLGKGRYQLISMKDGSYLTYATDGSAPVTGASGVWLLLKRLNGTYSLVPEGFADLRLHALGSKDGSALALREASSSEAQGFVFSVAKWLSTAVAKGSTVAEGVYTIKAGVGKKQVVQVKKASKKNGANVLTYKSNGDVTQRWRLVSAGNNLYTLQAIHSKQLLSVKGGATKSGSNVCQNKADGSLAQYWYLVKDGSEYYLRNAKSGMGLSVKNGAAKNGTNVQIFKSGTSRAQHYSLVRDIALEQAIKAGKTFAEGIYSVTAGVGNKLVLEMGDNSTANGAAAKVATSTSTLNQKVELTYLGYGFYSIQFANSGKYLHVKGSSTKAGASVIQWKRKTKGRSQKWYFVKTTKGYQLRSGISGMALEVKGGATKSGTAVVMAKAKASKDSENFKISQVSLLPNGTYVFASALDPAQLVEVKGSRKKAGANVQIGRMRKNAGQNWTITYLGNSTYKIVNKNSKLALEVKDASTAKGANVDQGVYKGTAAQKWILGISDSGTLTLKNVGSGKYLDLTGGKGKGGTNVQQWTKLEAKRQGFLPYTEASSFVKTGKSGYQNPKKYYQISAYNCVLPSYAHGFYTYVSPSGISPLATREECVEAFIARANKYLDTPYVWDWSMRPGEGVDCSGLVMQCLYAVGMQTPYNTYDHMYDPWQDHNAENMRVDKKFKKVSFKKRKRGDLIFYKGHVGIYLGNDEIINAYPPKVQVQSVYSWTVTGCRRVFV